MFFFLMKVNCYQAKHLLLFVFRLECALCECVCPSVPVCVGVFVCELVSTNIKPTAERAAEHR